MLNNFFTIDFRAKNIIDMVLEIIPKGFKIYCIVLYNCIVCTFIALNFCYIQILRRSILVVINESSPNIHITWPPVKGYIDLNFKVKLRPFCWFYTKNVCKSVPVLAIKFILGQNEIHSDLMSWQLRRIRVTRTRQHFFKDLLLRNL
jgi:hypothetical protein